MNAGFVFHHRVGEWDRAQNLDTYACRGVFLHYSHGHVIMTMLFSPRGDAVKEMAAGTFKAQCLAIMDHVFQSGEPVLITKHGKPVAKLVPAENQADDIFGYMTGKVKIVGDIVGPVTPPEDWECK